METKTPVRFGAEERVLKPFPLRHIIVLGGGPSSYAWVSSAGQREDIAGAARWAITGFGVPFQHDLLWDMHDPKRWTGHRRQRVVESRVPVVMPRTADDIPMSREYPFHEVLERFNQMYFTGGTFSYLMAFAIMCFEAGGGCKGAKIEAFGCDWNYPGLPGLERGRNNAEFWVGYAACLGIELHAPPNTTFLDANIREKGLYGYDYQPDISVSDNGQATLTGFSGWSRQFNIEQDLPGDSIKEAAE